MARSCILPLLGGSQSQSQSQRYAYKQNRLNCCQVCKSWNSSINQSYLLLETVFCGDLATQDKRIKLYFKQHAPLSARVNTLEYNLMGELPLQNLAPMPAILPHIKHLRLFTNDSVMYNRINSKGRRVAPRVGSFVQFDSSQRRKVYEARLDDTLEGCWSTTLESIEDASTNMLSSCLLNCSTQPFRHLTRLWLNYSSIALSSLENGMSYLFTGLKQAPAIKELALNYTHVNFAHLDLLHQHCQQLHSLTLGHVNISNHPSGPGQRFLYDMPPLHYEPAEAPQLKHLTIASATIVAGTPLLEYIAAKYKHVEHIKCLVSNAEPTRTQDIYKGQAASLISSCSALKYFECNLFSPTPLLLRMMDDRGIRMEEDLRLGFTDDPESFVVVCNSDHHKAAVKRVDMQINYYPEHFNDMILNLKNLTGLTINNIGYRVEEILYEEDDCYYESTMLPLNVLLNGLQHLEKLDLQGFFITVDRQETLQHSIKIMIFNQCTFDSFATQDNGALFSPCNYISTCCLKLQYLKLHGQWSYDPQKSEVSLRLFDHTELSGVEVFIEYSCPYVRHVDEEGAETWFEIQRPNMDSVFECVPIDNNQPPPRSNLEKPNYFTIECADSKLFYTQKVYYQEPYQF
ncbi:hypothetical protein MUCCIDRAFT_77891 [Mucor lusitanicus CBS 277.49]|uniref:Uncharacterized protein n=1 Tax=Mucor lusitanicus CBS 277.49 TaxID=747725 RepID=A0A162TTW0_MUCCL|nr:hypothetical protein MUCCIDRAFT_77891 [Mucor lusitanicus CBS 277.49]